MRKYGEYFWVFPSLMRWCLYVKDTTLVPLRLTSVCVCVCKHVHVCASVFMQVHVWYGLPMSRCLHVKWRSKLGDIQRCHLTGFWGETLSSTCGLFRLASELQGSSCLCILHCGHSGIKVISPWPFREVGASSPFPAEPSPRAAFLFYSSG